MLVFLLASCTLHVAANVEKTIFKAPDSISVPQDAAIDNLLLTRLHPGKLSTRTFLKASFPTDERPHGDETWLLAEGLNPGQRYEIRVCWLATQPTAFWLDTYTLQQAFETPDLISSLSSYSHTQHKQLQQSEIDQLLVSKYEPTSSSQATSQLFLRVQAAADYFSMNKTLMENVPPVHVDLILDPYVLNVLPQSLVPTAGYIAIIAVLAWFLAGWIYQQMIGLLNSDDVIRGSPGLKKNQ